MISRFFLTICSFLLAATAYGEGSIVHKNNPYSDIGRYQLFQGTYTAVDLKRQETKTQQAVFLIDTRTGRVKRYVNKIDTDGKYVEEWQSTELSVEKK